MPGGDELEQVGILDAAVDQLAAEGFDVVGHKADLSIGAECDALVDWTAERFGGIDVLINNTRGPRLGLVDELSDDDWRGPSTSCS